MKVFLAGATGAIGRPLIAELVRQEHTVTGMTRKSEAGFGLRATAAGVAEMTARSRRPQAAASVPHSGEPMRKDQP